MKAHPPRWLRVYPRVGGETTVTLPLLSFHQGLSPRGRGNLAGAAAGPEATGSIPAWAGKPHQPLPTYHQCKVYPRVGGETPEKAAITIGNAGLSPRGRGNHDRETGIFRWRGSIPAWAGKPSQP